ncbi:MAG: (d)CMP kinase [Candidatus Omnitrophica bacterium]|nr:(d)CMP kinase [Candidatus Omnitrophota bacterium]
MIIAVDGPAGAGKSTIARLLAAALGFLYVDTGAMYRAFTLKALRERVDFSDVPALAVLARRTAISLCPSGAGDLKVLLDGSDVSAQIRTPELTNAVFNVAQLPEIRAIMVEWQREYGKRQSLVMEGRDIGTVVFPQAEVKIYLDASAQIRARRRVAQLAAKGIGVDEAQTVREIEARDEKDFTRAVGPLRRAADAFYLDSSSLTIPQVVDTLLAHVNAQRSK